MKTTDFGKKTNRVIVTFLLLIIIAAVCVPLLSSCAGNEKPATPGFATVAGKLTPSTYEKTDGEWNIKVSLNNNEILFQGFREGSEKNGNISALVRLTVSESANGTLAVSVTTMKGNDGLNKTFTYMRAKRLSIAPEAVSVTVTADGVVSTPEANGENFNGIVTEAKTLYNEVFPLFNKTVSAISEGYTINDLHD